ncbi:hypothetical protein KSS87_001632 [Heliosperma pusillum]|nr:hypothetical protein KSS87_001632 [Heliosperma pusillum]
MAYKLITYEYTLYVCFLLLSISQAFSSKVRPRFPLSMVRPEQLAQITSNGHNNPYETRYFTQILDHFNFNPQSYQTFQHRYLLNDKYWGGAKKNAPIFVYMGNEGDIEWFANNTGFMFENAPHFNALLVFIEHRFYGKSIPYGGDIKVAYQNASTQGYLSSTQALADYATLILDLKRNLSATDSPVVSESENCYEVIKRSWTLIEQTAGQPGGIEKLRSSFNICKDITFTVDDIESWLATAYTYTSMTDYPTPSNFLNPLPAYPVKQMCKAIDNPKVGDDTFAKLYGAANIYYNYTANQKCFDITSNTDVHGLDEWTWQACTEMILPTDGNNKESIFPASTYSYHDRDEYCDLRYGVHPRPHWITTEFGGFDIHRVLRRYGSNIIFFNGVRDPWSGGGVLKNISNSLVAIVAEQGAHHVDLRFSTKEDPDWLKEVRELEINHIQQWITQYYRDLALYS